jgi:hypothetical protein
MHWIDSVVPILFHEGMSTESHSNIRLMDQSEIEFMILFEIGEPPAHPHVDIRSKDRSKREFATGQLAEKVSRRFKALSVYGPAPIQQGVI